MPAREILGKVISDRMDKTVVVEVEARKPHPRYRKIVKTTNKFKAHDEENAARIGDLVRIRESRPLSAHKRWRLVDIVERAK